MPCAVARNEIIKICTSHRLCRQGVLNPGSVIIYPDILRRLSLIKEKDVGLYAVCVEDTGGQAQDRMKIKVFQKLLAYFCGGTTIGQHIIRKHNTNTAASSYDGHDVLQEIHLIIGSLNKFRTVCIDFNTALRSDAKGRIGKNDIEDSVRLINKGVLANNRTCGSTNVVQVIARVP